MLMNITVEKKGYKCNRCNHEWLPRSNLPSRLPMVCPKCSSPYWNSERTNKIGEKKWKEE